MKKLTHGKSASKPAVKKSVSKKPSLKKKSLAGKKKLSGSKAVPKKAQTPIKKSAKGTKAAGRKKSIAISMPSATSNQSANSKRSTLFALIVGCDLYLPNSLPEGSYPSLHGCVSDASRVKDFLKERARLDESNLILLTSTEGPDGDPVEPPERQPTYENIINGFRDLTSRAKEGDHVYVHYSGHGGRCPTILPKVKGELPDETLVPINIGTKSARYIRDVEMAVLLKRMTDKKLVVTIVFDCCHSGGATRAVRRDNDSTGIRGVDFIDSTRRPTDSLVGSIEELQGTPNLPEVATSRGLTRGAAATTDAQTGCVVLAACRPFEFAREFAFDGGPRQGALTYWYLKLIGAGTVELTFRTIFDQIVKQIHDQFPDQTPMLLGNPDRTILGESSSGAVPAIPVTAASDTIVTLGAGKASLIDLGTEYAVYQPTAKDLTVVTDRVGVVRVTAVKPTEATAEVVTSSRPRGMRAGDKAVPIGVPLKLVRKVDVLRPDGNAPAKSDVALKAVFDNLSKETWIEPVARPGDPADFVVTTDKKGTIYQICDASDVPLEIRPQLSTTEPTAACQVVARLVHLARYQAVQSLDNVDPASVLLGKVVTELLRTPPGFQRGQPTDKLKPYPAGTVPRLKPGEWVVLSVTNRSKFAINLTILDLSSDWSVSVVDENGQFVFPVGAGEPPFHLPLQASLPDEQTSANDVLKVIATVDPPPGFDVLTLPKLDQPIPKSFDQRRATRSVSPFGALLAAASSDRPTRAMTTGTTATNGWSVTQVKLEVR